MSHISEGAAIRHIMTLTTNQRTRIHVPFFFFFQAEDGIRVRDVTGVQTCALPIRLVPADAVVLAGRIEPDPGLGDELAGRVPEVFAIGDCTGLGLIRKATDDATRVACSI